MSLKSLGGISLSKLKSKKTHREDRQAMTKPEPSVAIVAGAASGIGAAVAQVLHRKGDIVVACDIHEDLLAKQFENGYPGLEIMSLDVTQANNVLEVIDKVISKYSRIDVLVNTVGITGPTGIAGHVIDVEDFRKTFEVNYFGALHLQNAVLPHMIKQNYGRIMQVASIAGKEGNPNMAPYSSSKAALIGLVKSTAKEVANLGVTINSLAPAVIKTPINDDTPQEVVDYMISKIPMGRMGEVEEVAELIAFVVSPECSFTTGFVFDTSGGRATY
jgi:2-dehydro-3-deoxy-L-rhamnonate dehydrogenase (NAD+)